MCLESKKVSQSSYNISKLQTFSTFLIVKVVWIDNNLNCCLIGRFPSKQKFTTLTSTAMEAFAWTFLKSSGALLLQFPRYILLATFNLFLGFIYSFN